ncbi:MAG: VOC family protein [Candidatus Acidiferrales bacterium]
MAKPGLSEQLDRIVEAIVTRRGADGAGVDEKLAPLARIATGLRGLPREDFRQQLRSDLQRRIKMATAGVKPVREGFHTITQYLIVPDSGRMIDFLKEVFGAVETFRTTRPGTKTIMHAEARIGDSMIELADSSEQFPPMPAALHVFVEDVDSTYEKALHAGATSLLAPTDQEYGERGASIADEFGNHWYIATPLKGQTRPEGLRTVTPYLAVQDAARFIEFLKEGFGAEEKLVVKSPEGIVLHAKIGIGDSILEMSEAHEPYLPKPCGIHLYVPDIDALYEQALRAGATSIYAPADQPYGDRSGGVKDSSGNLWFLATHMRDVPF